MANKDTELVVTNQIGSSGNENVGDSEEIQKLRRQIIEIHRSWANGLPPPPVPTDNLEYLSSFPLMSHAQFSIFVNMPQHASVSTPGQQYPTTSKVHFLTPQSKTTIYSAPDAIHAFVALLPSEDPAFNINPTLNACYDRRTRGNSQKIEKFETDYEKLARTWGYKSVLYKDLCMFQGVYLPFDFKMLKFEKYDGHGDPVAYLRRYCNQLRGARGKEELLMAYFGENLSGLGSEWFKNTESFREYAIRWSEQTAGVKLSMKESKIVEVFIQVQDETYYQHFLPTLGKPFIEVLKMGKMIEDGIKTGRIVSFATLKATTQAIQKGLGSVVGKKNEEDASSIIVGQQAWARGLYHRYPRAQTQVYGQVQQNPSQKPLYSIPPSPYQVYNAQPYVQPPSYPHWLVPTLLSYPPTPHTYRSLSRPGF
ncbi:hypothetical protein P3L10_014085 [Capsicum annuum]